MDIYVRQILNSGNHDLFYTDASVKAAFKNYIKAFVGRYVNEPTILGWELANEPRCKGSTGYGSFLARITACPKHRLDIAQLRAPAHLQLLLPGPKRSLHTSNQSIITTLSRLAMKDSSTSRVMLRTLTSAFSFESCFQFCR